MFEFVGHNYYQLVKLIDLNVGHSLHEFKKLAGDSLMTWQKKKSVSEVEEASGSLKPQSQTNPFCSVPHE